MLRILYNALWYPALPFALMAGGTRGRQDRRERMGKLELASDRERPRIWIHASSVGEVEAIRSVAHGLLREFEGARLIVTTMTPTGRDAARRRIPGAELCALPPGQAPVRTSPARGRPDPRANRRRCAPLYADWGRARTGAGHRQHQVRS